MFLTGYCQYDWTECGQSAAHLCSRPVDVLPLAEVTVVGKGRLPLLPDLVGHTLVGLLADVPENDLSTEISKPITERGAF